MSSDPLVSVIIPAFNAEFFIRQTLNSVLRQTYRNIEVWVVDDGSQDKTPAIVEAYSAIDSRVKLLRQLNQGVAAARNLAIRHSNGEFLAPIDADDIWFKSKIERQVLRFQQAPEQTGLVYTWSAAISERGRLLGGCANWDVEGRPLTPLIYRNFIGNASVPLIRRECIERVGGYDPTLRQQDAQGCEDWDITLRIAEHYDFAVVPEFLVGYRQLDGSMSGNVSTMARSYEQIMKSIRKRHPEIPNCVFHWSAGYFYLYLTGKSYLSGNMPGALKWLWQSLHADPSLLCAPVAYRLFVVSLLRILASPVTSSIWPDQQAWLEWKQRLRRRKRARGKTIRDLMKAACKPRAAWKPYDLIQRRRDAQISACWQTGA
jgi:glycosyltransferase involved in cell wall biosynthesis